MEIKTYETLKEKLYHEKMENGLEVYLLKKEGFSKTYGLFATNFGSIDTSFVPLNQKEMVKVHDGVAHFLEHKMFEMVDGDASDKFSLLGASTNAFTSTNRTAYLFSTGSNEIKCTQLLLDFVQDIYLTDENVEKEKGIICQEIKMYDDDPDWQSYFGTIQDLYVNHPVAIDIAGTCDSVNATTLEELLMCYHTFYHPSNMVLFVVGNIEPESMMDMIRDNQNSKEFEKPQEIIRKVVDEPSTVLKKDTIQYMDVIMPKLMLGFKIDQVPSNPNDKIRREFLMNIFLDSLFTRSSDLYNNWLFEEIINDTFYATYTQERDYAFLTTGGDTNKVDKLKEKLIDVFSHITDYKMSKDVFERLKRKVIGQLIRMFNSPESIANIFTRYCFEGFSAFELIDLISSLKIEELDEVVSLINVDNSSFHLVLPFEK